MLYSSIGIWKDGVFKEAYFEVLRYDFPLLLIYYEYCNVRAQMNGVGAFIWIFETKYM